MRPPRDAATVRVAQHAHANPEGMRRLPERRPGASPRNSSGGTADIAANSRTAALPRMRSSGSISGDIRQLHPEAEVVTDMIAVSDIPIRAPSLRTARTHGSATVVLKGW